MKRKNERKAITVAGLFCVFIPLAYAELFELPLDCNGSYDLDTPTWTLELDLGIQFSQINNIYIDWSGKITAEWAENNFNGQDGPIDGRFKAKLYETTPYDSLGYAEIYAGESTYPNPELFNVQTDFTDDGWSMLYDGKCTVDIDFMYGWSFRAPEISTLIEPEGMIESAKLVVDGTVVPEPATILLLTAGVVIARRKSFKKSHHF
jgi:hypothetical protein